MSMVKQHSGQAGKSPGALDGLKVLDLTQHISGPYCTKLLADYGADVIKIEKPEVGDIARQMGPFPGNHPHREKSGLFLYLNTNKRGMALNLKIEKGRQLLLHLARWADVVVESFKPGTMERLGLGYSSLEKANKKLVVVSISNFGQSGPYRDSLASEIIEHGMGGSLRATGMPDREPTKYGAHVALQQAGSIAAAAVMTALFARERRGRGEHVDVSIFETQAGSQDRRTTMTLAAQHTGYVFPRRPMQFALATGTFPCADGYIHLSGSAARFPYTVKLIGREELLQHPTFGPMSNRSDPRIVEEFNQTILLPWLMQHTMQEVWHMAQAVGLACGPMYTPKDVMNDKTFRARGVWATVEHPEAGTVVMPGRPFILHRTPWSLRRPAPTLGQHNKEVLTDALRYSSEEVARFRRLGVI